MLRPTKKNYYKKNLHIFLHLPPFGNLCHFFSKAVDSSLSIRSQKLSINLLCPKFNKLELNFYKLLSFIVQSKSLFIHPHHCHGLNIFSPKSKKHEFVLV